MNDVGKFLRKATGVSCKTVSLHVPTQAAFSNVFLKLNHTQVKSLCKILVCSRLLSSFISSEYGFIQ